MDPEDEQAIYEACKIDDAESVNKILTANIEADDRTRQEFLGSALYYSIATQALSVLELVLEAGADASTVSVAHVLTASHPPVPSQSKLGRELVNRDLVSLLLRHGWDINKNNFRTPPLLWLAAGSPELARWCIRHGSKLELSEAEKVSGSLHSSLLEAVIWRDGGLQWLKELRQFGAPLRVRCLHVAAQNACAGQTTDCVRERLKVVRYLLDEEGLDVDSMDRVPDEQDDDEFDQRFDPYLGRPLAYCLSTTSYGIEALQFLSERGADPLLGIDAQISGQEQNETTYNAWQMAKSRRKIATANFINTVATFALENGTEITQCETKSLTHEWLNRWYDERYNFS